MAKQKADKDLTFEELVDWSAGYLLKELIRGNFRAAVWLVCARAANWKAREH